MKTADYSGAGGWSGENLSPDSAEVIAKQAKTGLWVFMAVISSLFFLFLIAFMLRSQFGDWEQLSSPWKPLADPWRLYVNTLLLACGSLCLQWSKVMAHRDERKRMIEGLLLAGIFTGGFILGQLWVWQQLVSLGYYVNSNPANSFFYLLTGLHGLHLLGGMVAWAKTIRRTWRSRVSKDIVLSIELCAMYWHYLLALWLVLLVLLTSSPQSYAAFARLCGF